MTTQAQTIFLKEANPAVTGSNWGSLYKASGVAALLSALFFPIQIIVFILNPPPSTVAGWFALFQNNYLVGLLDLDLLLIVDQALAILIFIGLFIALFRFNPSFATIGAALGLASTLLFIATNPAFAMLSLSDQYAAAATEAQRLTLLAAGQAVITGWQGSAFQASYILGSIAPVIISLVMLRCKLFSKATAYLGIASNVIALGLYVPKIGTYISVSSVVLLWAWYILLARGFILLGKSNHRIGMVPVAE